MRSTFIGALAVAVFALTAAGVSRAQNIGEGKKLYAANCSSCHGDTGKGDGIAGRALPAKPADHTDGAFMNALTDKWLLDIISKGGTATGKSSFMPAWGGALSEKQIQDILAYIRSLAVPAYKGAAAGK